LAWTGSPGDAAAAPGKVRARVVRGEHEDELAMSPRSGGRASLPAGAPLRPLDTA
jgi:hypothetical protein